MGIRRTGWRCQPCETTVDGGQGLAFSKEVNFMKGKKKISVKKNSNYLGTLLG
jgi:hypothetical protein